MALTRKTAAAVSVGTYSALESTLRLLGGARRFGTHRGRRGEGHIAAAACLQLVIIIIITLRAS